MLDSAVVMTYRAAGRNNGTLRLVGKPDCQSKPELENRIVDGIVYNGADGVVFVSYAEEVKCLPESRLVLSEEILNRWMYLEVECLGA